MNHTTDTFQKLTKRSSAKQYEEGTYKSKYKNCYSEERRAKRDWEQE